MKDFSHLYSPVNKTFILNKVIMLRYMFSLHYQKEYDKKEWFISFYFLTR